MLVNLNNSFIKLPWLWVL